MDTQMPAKLLNSRANTQRHHHILPAPITDTWKPSSGQSPVGPGITAAPDQVLLVQSRVRLKPPGPWSPRLQTSAGGPWGAVLPRTWAAAAAAPAPTGAGRILEFWECLTPPAHTSPAAGLSPGGSRAARSPPGADSLLASPPLPAENTSQRRAFVFLQEWGAGIGLCLLARTRMSGLRDPRKKFEERGGLFFQEPVSCFARHPLSL